jgi:hypothetical protein
VPEEPHTNPDQEGAGGGEAGPVRSAEDRLATLASYVQPDGSLRVPRLIVIDEAGNDRVVVGVEGAVAGVSVRVSPRWSPPGLSEVLVFAVDGDDNDLTPPSVGLELAAAGERVVAVSADLTPESGVQGAGGPVIRLHPWFSTRLFPGNRSPRR